MSKPLRAVVDTNVLVAAAIKPTGTARQLLDAVAEERWQPVISPVLLEELETVLRCPKFASKLTEQLIDDFVASVVSVSEIAADPPSPAPRTPDPDDDYLIALALASNTPVLVSGDRHLTELAYPDILVQTPRDFLDQLANRA